MSTNRSENATKKKCTMTSEQLSFLQSKAANYIWWKTPEEAIEFPLLVLGQVMDLCNWGDLIDLEKTFSKEELLSFLEDAEAGQLRPRSWNFWHIRLGFEYEDIPLYPVRFESDITPQRADTPLATEERVLTVASLDLMATKLKVILQRSYVKDYQDIAAMIKADVSLEKGLATARQIFGQTFAPVESLRALNYFEDGDLVKLKKEERKIICDATRKVSSEGLSEHQEENCGPKG
ncbi:MAG: hypothetical protein WBB23_22540 [Desulforhopalus sp.]